MISPSRASMNIHYAIREVTVMARKVAAQGRRVLYLNIGDPNAYDFDMAPEAKAAAIWAINNQKNGYAPSEGVDEALLAIETDARERLGIKPIIGSFTGNGASECIELALAALLNPEDNVLLPSPTYPLYVASLASIGVEARFYQLDPNNDWAPDLDHMASLIDEHTRAVVIINPNNPTGAVCDEACLRGVIDLAKANNLLILNDEIYERLHLDKGSEHCSLAALDPEACVVTFNGLSKSYLGPGIRMGWGILSGPIEQMSDYFEAIKRMLRARLCASHPFQYAIKACLEGDQAHLQGFVETLRQRSALCNRRIAEIPGLSCHPARGSFYLFVRVEGIQDDIAWCRELLEETGVVVVPGSGFSYTEEGAGYFRIVFLPNEDILNEAFDKIAQFMATKAKV